jgi:tRNA G18 (ribose-2'-O)-methylase SpoU
MFEVVVMPNSGAGVVAGRATAVGGGAFGLLTLTPAADARPIQRLTAEQGRRPALLLGAEGPGLSRSALAASDVRVAIPMHRGVDSLNVAAAAAVAFWELSRTGPMSAG